MKRSYFYKEVQRNYTYKVNFLPIYIICFLYGITSKSINLEVKNRFCLYKYNHNKVLHKFINIIIDLSILYMFIFKYDIPCLDNVSFENRVLKELNNKYYFKNPIVQSEDFDEEYTLNGKSLSLFLIRYYLYNKIWLYYTIQDEIIDTTFNYFKMIYKNDMK